VSLANGKVAAGTWTRRAAQVLAALAAVVVTLLAAGTARAQQQTFYLDRIQISGAPDDGVVVWRPYMA